MTRVSSLLLLLMLSFVLFSETLIAQDDRDRPRHEPKEIQYPQLVERGVFRAPSYGTRIQFENDRGDDLKVVDVKTEKVSVFRRDPRLGREIDGSDLYDVVQQYEFFNPKTSRYEWVDASKVRVLKESEAERRERIRQNELRAEQQRQRNKRIRAQQRTRESPPAPKEEIYQEEAPAKNHGERSKH